MDTTFKNRIVEAIKADARRYGSGTKHAKALGISPSQLSRIKRGDVDQVLSDGKWINIARRLGVRVDNSPEWKVARTPAFEYIYSQMEFCQVNNVSAVLCDIPDIGKTFTARHYVREHRHAVYIDCSQYKTKQQLIRAIAREFGVDDKGRYRDVYEDLIWYLKSIENPLIVLDEAGDLNYNAFLELKALWNATEGSAAYYMMGADGLRVKIEKGSERKKVGFAEILSRFGDGYKRVTPAGKEELERFRKVQMAMVAKVNGIGLPMTKLYARTGGSLRRVYIERKKELAV